MAEAEGGVIKAVVVLNDCSAHLALLVLVPVVA